RLLLGHVLAPREAVADRGAQVRVRLPRLAGQAGRVLPCDQRRARRALAQSRARPQKLFGVGFTSEGFDHSVGYHQMPDARDPRAAFMLAGIGPDEVIGDFGLAGGGASGYEIDRYDLALGTPPNAMLLATSLEHSVNYPHVCEEIYFNYPGMDGTNDFMVRADLVYFTTRAGGGVFSTSSIAWC